MQPSSPAARTGRRGVQGRRPRSRSCPGTPRPAAGRRARGRDGGTDRGVDWRVVGAQRWRGARGSSHMARGQAWSRWRGRLLVYRPLVLPAPSTEARGSACGQGGRSAIVPRRAVRPLQGSASQTEPQPGWGGLARCAPGSMCSRQACPCHAGEDTTGGCSPTSKSPQEHPSALRPRHAEMPDRPLPGPGSTGAASACKRKAEAEGTGGRSCQRLAQRLLPAAGSGWDAPTAAAPAPVQALPRLPTRPARLCLPRVLGHLPAQGYHPSRRARL